MVLGPIDPKFLITNFGLLWQKCGLNKCDPYQADWYPVFEACMNFLVVQLPIMPTAGKWPWIQNKWTISGPVTFYLKVISGDVNVSSNSKQVLDDTQSHKTKTKRCKWRNTKPVIVFVHVHSCKKLWQIQRYIVICTIALFLELTLCYGWRGFHHAYQASRVHRSPDTATPNLFFPGCLMTKVVIEEVHRNTQWWWD